MVFPMKRLQIFIVSVLLLLCAFLLYSPANAWAAGASVTVTVSPQSPQVGDIFTINLTFSSSRSIGSFEADLTYDEYSMEFVSGGGNAVELSGGTGGIVDNGSADTKVLSYALRFRAIKAGEADFSVTGTEINDFDTGENLGNLTQSSTVSIAEKTAPTPTAPVPTPSLQEPISVSMDGKTLYVLRDFMGTTLPDGFDPITISYHGTIIQAAQHPSGLTLLLVLGTAGNESFYIYDTESDALYPYVTIAAGGGGYTVFPLINVSSAGYTPTAITIGNQSIGALACETNAGFYLLYAMNSQGTRGYYFYDATEGTMQRASAQDIEQLVTDTAEDAATAQTEIPLNVWLLFIILAGVCILLLTLIVLQIRKHRK